jgi:hypothetical protein
MKVGSWMRPKGCRLATLECCLDCVSGLCLGYRGYAVFFVRVSRWLELSGFLLPMRVWLVELWTTRIVFLFKKLNVGALLDGRNE